MDPARQKSDPRAMDLLLIRHGIAGPATPALNDEARELTERGVERFTQVVCGLDRLGLRPAHIFHSPFRRTVQTAELLQPIADGPCEPTPHLIDHPNAELLELLREHTSDRCVALVGHQPHLSELAVLLIGGSPRAAEKLIFDPGGVAIVEGLPHPNGMHLRAFYPARLLATLGQS